MRLKEYQTNDVLNGDKVNGECCKYQAIIELYVGLQADVCLGHCSYIRLAKFGKFDLLLFFGCSAILQCPRTKRCVDLNTQW